MATTGKTRGRKTRDEVYSCLYQKFIQDPRYSLGLHQAVVLAQRVTDVIDTAMKEDVAYRESREVLARRAELFELVEELGFDRGWLNGLCVERRNHILAEQHQHPRTFEEEMGMSRDEYLRQVADAVGIPAGARDCNNR